MRPPTPVMDRLLPKLELDVETKCWLFTGYRDRSGYGRIGMPGGRARLAHAVSYELFVGPVPDGLELDHLCRTRACVNPSHLEPVTHRVNLLRGRTVTAAAAAATHCPAGHPYDEANTYRSPSRGDRLCRACDRDRQRARRAARKRT